MLWSLNDSRDEFFGIYLIQVVPEHHVAAIGASATLLIKRVR